MTQLGTMLPNLSQLQLNDAISAGSNSRRWSWLMKLKNESGSQPQIVYAFLSYHLRYNPDKSYELIFSDIGPVYTATYSWFHQKAMDVEQLPKEEQVRQFLEDHVKQVWPEFSVQKSDSSAGSDLVELMYNINFNVGFVKILFQQTAPSLDFPEDFYKASDPAQIPYYFLDNFQVSQTRFLIHAINAANILPRVKVNVFAEIQTKNKSDIENFRVISNTKFRLSTIFSLNAYRTAVLKLSCYAVETALNTQQVPTITSADFNTLISDPTFTLESVDINYHVMFNKATEEYAVVYMNKGVEDVSQLCEVVKNILAACIQRLQQTVQTYDTYAFFVPDVSEVIAAAQNEVA